MRAVLSLMADRIAHRGPDDAGLWTMPAIGIGLAHRRLSILDLSPAGHQPMASASGRHVLVLNGEIYNHAELRHELEDQDRAPVWRGRSDTESLVAAIEAWGIDAALERSVGMFAFAVWDTAGRALYLARDRMGEKPLYYGWQGDTFAFASELKALRVVPGFSGEVDRGALALLLRHNYIAAPHTVYRGIHKLPAGTFARISLGDAQWRARRLDCHTYWSMRSVAENGLAHPYQGSEEDALAELDEHLRRTLRLQMQADVPLGTLLSGGIDSSTVAALMQQLSARQVRTFSIGFHESAYNEAEHAKAVAAHLGTAHTELYVTPKDALEVIPRLPVYFDEPFADSSQIPTILLARMARQHVKVVLSGDGGDELFGGYSRYFRMAALQRAMGWMPRPLRLAAAFGIRAVPTTAWDRVFRLASVPVPRLGQVERPGDRAHKLAELLCLGDLESLYRAFVSHWADPAKVVIGAEEAPTAVSGPETWLRAKALHHRLMLADAVSYLPDDILVKVDRAAMGVGLETRVPLLDHRVVQFAWRLPLAMKVRGAQGKRILRRLLNTYVPESLTSRPKMGFGVPVGEWLCGPLRQWAEDLLAESRLRGEGYFEPAPVRRKWQEHLSGRRNWQYHLWDVLMFQAWLEHQDR